MGDGEILLWTFRNDASRVDGLVAAVVVMLDVGEIHRLGNPRPLINLPQPVRQIRIIGDPPQVAFEVPVIHRIETNQRGEQADVRFGQVLTGQVTVGAQQLLQSIQLGKQFIEGLFISALRRGKPGAVHAVVHSRIDPLVQRIDFTAQRSRIEIQVIAGQFIEGAVEHADDFRRFIVDDAFLLVVPQHRHGDAAGVVGGVGGVALVHEVEVIELVAGGAVGLVEGPAVFQHQEADH